jgi:hypothetical protein
VIGDDGLHFNPDMLECIADADLPLNSDSDECARLFEPQHAPVVLLYGKIEGSQSHSRQRLCDLMHTKIAGGVGLSALYNTDPAHFANVLCLEGVFTHQLEYFICASTVVVVEHYFAQSALETHRIDPLLQAGKIVLTTPSSDIHLEQAYASALYITARNNLVRELKSVLDVHYFSPAIASRARKRKPSSKVEKNKQRMHTNRLQIQSEFVHERSKQLDPLCFALRSMQESVDLLKKKKDAASKT